jgi:hypothetical protein
VKLQDEQPGSGRLAGQERRWPALLALFAVAALLMVLPEPMSIGPRWLVLGLVAVLATITVVARRRGLRRWNQGFSYVSIGLVTGAMVWSLVALLRSLPGHSLPPKQLLLVASVLWVSNVLVFAAWYWRLDAGGPNARDLRNVHTEGAFLFPQMTMESLRVPEGARGWSPGFVDYLFLAFTASTALSPTDSPVLSRWAKLLMMVQATISLVTVALLAARAINIL